MAGGRAAVGGRQEAGEGADRACYEAHEGAASYCGVETGGAAEDAGDEGAYGQENDWAPVEQEVEISVGGTEVGVHRGWGGGKGKPKYGLVGGEQSEYGESVPVQRSVCQWWWRAV